MLADQIALPGVADYTTEVSPPTATVDGGNPTFDITVTIRDANLVRVPLVTVSASSANPAAATVTGCLTGASGTCDVTITRVLPPVAPLVNPVAITIGDQTVAVTVN